VVVSGLSEKNREKLLAAGAENYLKKGTLMPDRRINLLPVIPSIDQLRKLRESA